MVESRVGQLSAQRRLALNYYRLKPVGSKAFRELRTEVLRSRGGHLKIVTAVIWLSSLLLADVFHDYLIRHIAAGSHEVAASP